MRRQRGLDCEGAETLRAFVGFLMRMDANVPHKVTWLLELFGAVRTLMPSHTIHLYTQQ